ncbi:MAG: hypothetical protein DDT19_00546 [Syntrophomonadaceae bacterium]|nr:hypothetical protein [Bacillota bacterium]
METPLTLEFLKALPPYMIFSGGTAENNENGLFITSNPKYYNAKLRWVAVSGGINDWAIYCHLSEYNEEWIARHGDKVHMEKNIRMLVPCTEEAFAMYRH